MLNFLLFLYNFLSTANNLFYMNNSVEKVEKFNRFGFKNELRNHLNSRDCVFLCIGSDKVTGDCLGPLTGHLLKNILNINAYVYGTLDMPINALNFSTVKKFIQNKHKKSKIITIDACLGSADDIGKIRVINKPIAAGSAFNKNLEPFGDASILATVNCGTKNDNFSLFSTPLWLVYKLANLIAMTISELLNQKPI